MPYSAGSCLNEPKEKMNHLPDWSILAGLLMLFVTEASVAAWYLLL
jgi:hypothetical protein